MSRPMRVLAVSVAALLSAVTIVFTGCSVPEDSPVAANPTTTESPFPDMDVVDDMGLPLRIPEGVASAAERGAQMSFAMMDRQTGAYFASGDTEQVETASISKLFIADDILRGAEIAQVPVDQDVFEAMTTMLRSSDDGAANTLWNRYGGNNIITRVTERYGLTATSPPWDGLWWNTMTSASELVAYYTRLLDGVGGLSPASTATMIGLLRESTPVATDGYN
ncbi:MAG: serine hydrolase, partial [Rhodococcus sp. (in: high G+C Gram-positive bacteria)]